MTDASVERAARFIAEAHAARAPFAHIPAPDRPTDAERAYLVQDRVQALFAEAGRGEIAGWKIGLTTPVMQAFVGFDLPCAGAIFAPDVRPSPARLARADFVGAGVECEVALRLGADMAGTDGGYDRARAAEAVAACMAAFEIIDDRGCDYATLDAPALICDNSWNAGMVLGPEVSDWRGLDLGAVRGRLEMNGALAGEGRGADALGHPLDALAWLANLMIGRGRPLRAGMLVSTGSIVKTQYPKAGDSARFEIPGLGTVEVAFE